MSEGGRSIRVGASRRTLILLLAITIVGLLHHADHVLRADHSGWPFTAQVTPFTYSLAAYLLLLMVFLARTRPLVGAALLTLMLLFTQLSHIFVETPADQFGTWAGNASTDPTTLGQPNLLGVESPLLGGLAAANSVLLSILMLAAIVALIADSRRAAAKRRQAIA